jgi:type II secretory pathway pseudopilin PulG
MTEPRVEQTLSAEPVPATERHGFALPLVLLVIAVLTVTLAAGFASTTTEIQTNNSQRAEARAFALAENGLQDFLAMRDRRTSGYCALCGSPPTTTYESTTVALPGGYATVVAQRVARNRGIKRPAIYLIRSRGVDTTTRLSALLRNSSTHGFVSNVRAERTVAQYAYWDLKVINIVAGWTALSGLGVNGASATLSGKDGCGADTIGVSGLAVPNNGFAGNTTIAEANPPNAPIKQMGTQQQTADKTMIDWAGVIAETSITPDITIDPVNGPIKTIPANLFSGPPAYPAWPIIHIKNPPNPPPPSTSTTNTFDMPAGQGLLIVDNDVSFSGGGTWNGIILVGNRMTSNGGNTVNGAVITGLNYKLPAPNNWTGQDAVGNGTKFYQYNSCNVAAATAGIGHYRLFPNAWMDNFTTY